MSGNGLRGGGPPRGTELAAARAQLPPQRIA
jgi:hypothetical protein